MSVPALVIDTNWVLDLWVFDDPRALPLRQALQEGAVRWIGCTPMRDELERVLTYPAVHKRMQTRGLSTADVLTLYDRWCQPHPVPPACRHRCRDRDDQVFIDLATAHQARLLSKDALVLRMHRQLAQVGVPVQSTWN
ncbi:MAG TPA: putative toxin-antitoxin system toxin component, PIN family [Macromonas sp.]|nr:putative toxin-antitoxin system toxin component, PIN family [Macromonas sp.]